MGLFNFHVKSDPEVVQSLHRIEKLLTRIEQKLGAGSSNQEEIMADLQALAEQVDRVEAETTAQTTLAESAETMLNQLSEIIRANATDPEALAALADRLSSASAAGESANARLTAALSANTPDAGNGGGEEPPPEEPPVA